MRSNTPEPSEGFPYITARVIPRRIRAEPLKEEVDSLSSKKIAPPIAAIGAFKVKSIPVLRGPILAIAVNRATSPTKIPIRPDNAMSAVSLKFKVLQPPEIVAAITNMTLT